VLPESWRHGINKTTLYNWKLLADAQLDIAG